MGDNTYNLTSPVMGTFYQAGAPGEIPYIKEGQTIKAFDLVCMIESMKIFTE
ncbi:MAG: acetyl-CoA carboxylase biotin carboxyl carrier protein, partial [Desulfobacteraceae bacterium]|nr:acetyl-CoA carboxylase biotin carboxyl carrier protein [Desulfobacteraceae bacterium]